MNRKAIPRLIQEKVLTLCKRRCCLCYGIDNDIGEKRGQIAHLDRNSNNNKIDNLAFLCLHHHDAYDSKTSQSKNYTIEEVKNYRNKLNLEIKDLISTSNNSKKKQELKLSLGFLPYTNPILFGREKELDFLKTCLSDSSKNIVSIIAWGGVGKTALINNWLNTLQTESFVDIDCVYGYSFYSQGSALDRQVSSDHFINNALKWFGDPAPEEGTAWDRGKRLAKLIQRQKTLLILDGFEPLQYPPGVLEGRIKDNGVRSLLLELMRNNPGLCIISSRLKIIDINVSLGYTVKELHLEKLSNDAGTQLLKHNKCYGSNIELIYACEEYEGHALSLTLLSHYIRIVYQGDIRLRDQINITKEKRFGQHANRVISAYEEWFENKPELSILYILGLFNKPIDFDILDFLQENPITGLTDVLADLSSEDKKYAINNLYELGLLAKPNIEYLPDFVLDCHPLIREYFAEKLKQDNPNVWQEAHQLLYKYFREIPLKECPDTIEEMEPLFNAVRHGCIGGLHQKVFSEVYWKRIQRKENYFLIYNLGGLGIDLSIISHFFEIPWSQLDSKLKAKDKAEILSITGYLLRSQIYLIQAVKTMQIAVEEFIKIKNWTEAAREAGNLSVVYLFLGHINKAINTAEKSVELADKSRDLSQMEKRRTDLADAIYQSGNIEKARIIFSEAEDILKEQTNKHSFLSTKSGFQYCDLLLEIGKFEEVEQRTKKYNKIC